MAAVCPGLRRDDHKLPNSLHLIRQPSKMRLGFGGLNFSRHGFTSQFD